MANFAQRSDLLADLAEDRAVADLVNEHAYWEEVTRKRFQRYFDTLRSEFLDLVNGRYRVASVPSKEVGSGTLKPRKVGATSFASANHSFVLEPGHVYGFIADSTSGVPVGLNVRKKDTSEFLKDEKDAQQAPPGLAPSTLVSVKEKTSVDVTVFGMISQPADYVLYAYTWDEPKVPDTTDTNTTNAASPP